MRRSALAKRSFESLGATVGWALGDRPLGFDGIETDLGGIESGRLDVGAASLTADVTLWPRLGVVVANPKAWKALSERRRKAMREAGRASLSAAIDTLQRDEDESYDVLCRRGGDVVHARDGAPTSKRCARPSRRSPPGSTRP